MSDNRLKNNIESIQTTLNSLVGISQEILTAEQTQTLGILNQVDGISTSMSVYDSPEEVEEILDEILGTEEEEEGE